MTSFQIAKGGERRYVMCFGEMSDLNPGTLGYRAKRIANCDRCQAVCLTPSHASCLPPLLPFLPLYFLHSLPLSIYPCPMPFLWWQLRRQVHQLKCSVAACTTAHAGVPDGDCPATTSRVFDQSTISTNLHRAAVHVQSTSQVSSTDSEPNIQDIEKFH
jgi:hypothetical protein